MIAVSGHRSQSAAVCVHVQSIVLSAGDKNCGQTVIFLVLGLCVYLEKLIAVVYENCVCPCVCPPRCSRAVKKVEFTLEQAMKAHREGRGIALLFI
jgi:hypothetical protein